MKKFFFLVRKKILFKLIRTTYWTRMISDKRPDETDDYRILNQSMDQNSEVILNEIELRSSKEIDVEHRSKNECISGLMNFVCGFDELSQQADRPSTQKLQVQKQSEAKRRIENFYSLNQSKKSKLILNVNLILIILIAIGLYIFFSIPPQYHIFKNLNKNSTYL